MESIQVTITKMYANNSGRNEVTYGRNVARGFTTDESAVMWLLDMFVRYGNDYGRGITIHDLGENFVDIGCATFNAPVGVGTYTAVDLEGQHGWSYEFRGTPDQLAKLKDMIMICIRSIAADYPEVMSELIDKIAVQQMQREAMMA